MTTLTRVLEEEVVRLMRKPVQQRIAEMNAVSSQLQEEIDALKRMLKECENAITDRSKPSVFTVVDQRASVKTRRRAGVTRARKAAAKTSAKKDKPSGVGFSLGKVKSERIRLGLSVADYAVLAGVSEMSIYNWENGTSRPRARNVFALAKIEGMSKRQVKERLVRTSS